MTLPFPAGFSGAGAVDLTAPTGLSVTIVATVEPFTVRTDTLDLQWTDQSTDESEWEIHRSLTSGGGFSLIDTITTSNKPGTGGTETYNDVSAKNDDDEYFYKVRAKAGGNVGAFSNESSEFTDVTQPGAALWTATYPKDDPTPPTDNDSLLLNVQPSTGAIDVDMYAKEGSTMGGDPVANGALVTGAAIPTGSIVSVDFDHDAQSPAVGPGETFFYQFRMCVPSASANNGNKVCSAFGSEQSATATAVFAESLSDGIDFGEATTVEVKTSASDGVDFGETVTFLAKTPPTGLTADPQNATDDKVDTAWNAVTDAVSYDVQRSVDPCCTWVTISDNQTGLTYTDTGRSPNTKYHYRVRANFASGGGNPGPYSSSVFTFTHVEAPDVTGLTGDTAGCPGQLDITANLNHNNTDGDDRTEAGTSEFKSATTQAGLGSATYGDSTAFSASAATVTHTNVNQSDTWFRLRAKYNSETLWDESTEENIECPV